MQHINDILNAPGEFKKVNSNGRYFLEKCFQIIGEFV